MCNYYCDAGMRMCGCVGEELTWRGGAGAVPLAAARGRGDGHDALGRPEHEVSLVHALHGCGQNALEITLTPTHLPYQAGMLWKRRVKLFSTGLELHI